MLPRDRQVNEMADIVVHSCTKIPENPGVTSQSRGKCPNDKINGELALISTLFACRISSLLYPPAPQDQGHGGYQQDLPGVARNATAGGPSPAVF